MYALVHVSIIVYLIIYAHQIITFGWLRNYGAKISKMHTVGVGGIVPVTYF